HFMRRLLAFVVAGLFLLPAAAFAQDSTLLWELDQENFLDVTDLGFRFYYPTGWVWGTGESGIVIAPTEADLEAQLDDDDSTLPEGHVITIVGIPLTALAELGENPTLEQLADFVVEIGGISESERFELPVMSRRALWVLGENSLGRSGAGAMWTQNGYLVLSSLGATDPATLIDSMFTWGYTMGRVIPLAAEDLGSGALSSEVTGFTMQYPDSWTPDPDAQQATTVVYELADDINQELADVDGIFLSVIDTPLADLGFDDSFTASDLSETMTGSFGLGEGSLHEEFVFLEQPAIVSSGEISAGAGGTRGLILTSVVVNGNGVVFVLLAPTAARAAEFLPTWTSMMQSVVSTATS
ncbi:MAG: hypothetical protein K8I30_09395, partial [Anaerolineae bacterium]|nr:hypothetical protein [Anaerolineae bacterium]